VAEGHKQQSKNLRFFFILGGALNLRVFIVVVGFVSTYGANKKAYYLFVFMAFGHKNK
jgi:hypothetical protein